MTAVADHPPGADPGAGDTDDLALIRAAIGRLAGSCRTPGPPRPVGPDGRATLIDEIVEIETLKACLEAVQAERTLAFARAEAAHQIDRGLTEPEKIERSIAGQLSPACRVSVTEARTRVRTARDLHLGLDHLHGLFCAGEMNAHKVSIIVAETAHLDAAERAEVDRLLAADGIEGRGAGKLRGLARKLAAQVAPGKFRARCAAARTGRRVTLRLGTDGMTDLTAHLPAEQGAACYAALQKAFNQISVNPAPLTRSRGQVMADTLVERLTGQATTDDTNIDVQVVVPIEALLDPTTPLPAQIPGLGPIPTEVITSNTGRKTWRRLLTRHGTVIGGDSRRRKFSGPLADLIRARDHWRCSEPYCDAPVRETDHIRRAADGGTTTFDQGRSTCQFHNQLREQPGWRVERVPDGILTTTPTGHGYLYRIPSAGPG